MAGSPFWGNASHIGDTFSDDPQDIVFLGGDPLPGICEVKGIAQLELDKKKTKGTNGVRLTVTGYQPGPFEVSVKYWTQAQDEFLQAWIEKFWIAPRKARPEFTTAKKRTGSNPDGSPQFTTISVKNRAPSVAISISHPDLDTLGITSCVVQGISIPELNGDFKTVKIKVVEHVEPTKTATKSAKATASDIPLAARLGTKAKGDIPDKPSATRADLGPKGLRTPAASGSD